MHFGPEIQWRYSQGHLDLQMTFKSLFRILCILSVKYLILVYKRFSKFWGEIIKVTDFDLDLQMTFKSRFLIPHVLEIKYIFFHTFGDYIFFLYILGL